MTEYSSKTALEAEKCGVNAKVYMKAVVALADIKKKYEGTGSKYTNAKRSEIENYLQSVCRDYKEYYFLLGTVYPSVKKSIEYIKYVG